ncbi:hypothetical protein HDU97_009250 [Phlyctochytrium planicorne]|nr:hypothetical protein HDU97_009250 [Phlyctochytrium planicorne]
MERIIPRTPRLYQKLFSWRQKVFPVSAHPPPPLPEKTFLNITIETTKDLEEKYDGLLANPTNLDVVLEEKVDLPTYPIEKANAGLLADATSNMELNGSRDRSRNLSVIVDKEGDMKKSRSFPALDLKKTALATGKITVLAVANTLSLLEEAYAFARNDYAFVSFISTINASAGIYFVLFPGLEQNFEAALVQLKTMALYLSGFRLETSHR